MSGDPYTVNMSSATPVLTLTPQAKTIIEDAWRNEEQHDTLALWVEVTGVRGTGYSYDLFFQDREGHDEEVVTEVDGDLTIVIPARSVERLRGSRLEFSEIGRAHV